VLFFEGWCPVKKKIRPETSSIQRNWVNQR